jgi:hypothetical protein
LLVGWLRNCSWMCEVIIKESANGGATDYFFFF